MGVLLLSAEIDKADTEDQQHPAGVKAHGTVAEVCVAAGGLGVILVLKDIGTGKSTCSCDERLLAWGCWKQRAEGEPFTERPIRPTPGPINKPRPPTTSSSEGPPARSQEGQTQVVTRNRAQYVVKIKD